MTEFRIPKGTGLKVIEKTDKKIVYELPNGGKLTVSLGKGGDKK